jgi:hypothetical protein
MTLQPCALVDARRLVAASILFFTAAAGADSVRYVDDSAPSGGDGLAWATAYRFLQDALDEAADPKQGIDEIRVGAGLQRPDRSAAYPNGTGDRAATFALIEGVTVAGGYAGFGAPDPDERDVTAHATTLSGDLLGDDGAGGTRADNSHHVVRAGAVTEAAVIDGFTVSGGNSTGAPADHGGGLYGSPGGATVRACTFVGNTTSATGRGGGVHVDGAMTIEDCVFVGNTAATVTDIGMGGGALFVGGSARVTRSRFTGNAAGDGGAVFVAGRAVMIDCLFEGNAATFGGALYMRKHGSLANGLTLVRCTLTGNAADDSGGGIYFDSGDPGAVVTNCRFIENEAVANTGGAMARPVDDTRVSNTVFAGNRAGRGGAISTRHPGLELSSCTFVGNVATLAGGGVYQFDDDEPRVTNAIFWENRDAGGMDESAQLDRVASGYDTPVVHYSLIQGLTGAFGGTGNIDADPRFADRSGPDGDPETHGDNDYGLGPGSPGIDAAHNWGVLDDVADLDGDGDTLESTPHGLDGLPRFAENASHEDTGCGVPAIVDMGAFEGPGDSADTILRGDVDGDLRVGVSDLLLVLAAWGPVGDECLADVTLDGIVGVPDLLAVLANWR